MDTRISVLSDSWKLYYEENAKCSSFADAICDEKELVSKKFKSANGRVPGNFVLDLYKEGIIPDPLFGDNAIKLQYLEAMHVWYCTEFDSSEDGLYLMFEGLDTIADVFLDGIHVLRAENMFISHKTGTVVSKGHHKLVVHFTPPVIESKKYSFPVASNALWYNYQGMYIRKPAHSFGWDIFPRIVSCGIWKPVYLMKPKADSIKDVYVYTLYANAEENKAKIRIVFDVDTSGDLIQEYRIRFSGKCGDSEFSEEMTLWGNQYGRMAFTVKNPKLWWPRGYGKPDVYDCKAELIKDGKILDTYITTVGIRTVELDRSESIKNGNGKFTFKINGTPVFWRGVNWVPLSPYACENEERLPMYLNLLYGTNSNAVRMWGGGIYESDTFFDYCDRNGIMVWQDFMMACAVYPNDEIFKKKIEEEAVFQIKRLRKHASLILWSGDNECDCTYNTWNGVVRDPNKNVITRRWLPELITNHDFSRPYLPSSPYISEECYKENLSSPEEHLWGNRPYFKSDFYVKSQCCFVSEIGYPGIVSPKSLKKFIGKDFLYPPEDDKGRVNDHWEAHAVETMITDEESPYKYRIPLVLNKIKETYGGLPEKLEDCVKMSQIIQAEAVKSFIELFRANKWRRTGIIYWNLADGCPMTSEAVADFYGEKKLSYKYMNRAYEPVCLMIKETDGKYELVVSNDTLSSADIKYTVTDCETGSIMASGKFTSKANDAEKISDIEFPSTDTFVLIEWETDGKKFKNHFIADIRKVTYKKYIEELDKCKYGDLFDF